MKHKSQDVDSVHTALMPAADESIDWQGEQAKWDRIMALRDDVLRVLEGLRQSQQIASNQEAAVSIVSDDDELISTINDLGIDAFAALCIVSDVTIRKGSAADVTAQKSDNSKCQRCWNYFASVGDNAEYEYLCQRCVEVVSSL